MLTFAPKLIVKTPDGVEHEMQTQQDVIDMVTLSKEQGLLFVCHGAFLAGERVAFGSDWIAHVMEWGDEDKEPMYRCGLIRWELVKPWRAMLWWRKTARRERQRLKSTRIWANECDAAFRNAKRAWRLQRKSNAAGQTPAAKKETP